MPSLATRSAYARHRAAQTNRTDAIDGSYTAGGDILSATFGATETGPTIHIAAHSRIYGAGSAFGERGLLVGGRTVLISSATIATTAAGVEHVIYYDDLTLKSTRPTVHASTSAAVGQANYAIGRHCLGPITTPTSAGSTGTSGGGTRPPGDGWTDVLP